MIVATVTSYGDGASVYQNALLLDSDVYKKFIVRLQPSDTSSNDTLDLTITTSTGSQYNYSKPFTTTAMTEYTFDISNVTGTITGFFLKPTVTELALYVDYIRFEEQARVDGDLTACYFSNNQVTANVALDYIELPCNPWYL